MKKKKPCGRLKNTEKQPVLGCEFSQHLCLSSGPCTGVQPRDRGGPHCQPGLDILGTYLSLFVTCHRPPICWASSALGSEVAGWGSPCATSPGTHQCAHGFSSDTLQTGEEWTSLACSPGLGHLCSHCPGWAEGNFSKFSGFKLKKAPQNNQTRNFMLFGLFF